MLLLLRDSWNDNLFLAVFCLTCSRPVHIQTLQLLSESGIVDWDATCTIDCVIGAGNSPPQARGAVFCGLGKAQVSADHVQCCTPNCTQLAGIAGKRFLAAITATCKHDVVSTHISVREPRLAHSAHTMQCRAAAAVPVIAVGQQFDRSGPQLIGLAEMH